MKFLTKQSKITLTDLLGVIIIMAATTAFFWTKDTYYFNVSILIMVSGIFYKVRYDC